MQSKAATVAEYLKSLPEDRRDAIAALRKVILANLDKDYEEGMQYGMIGYYVPHRVFPAGYHCDPKQPLPYMGLASQKNHLSVYIMPVAGGTELETWFRDAWEKTGRRLDMGKCCVRFRRIEDAALDVIAQTVKRTPAKKYIAWYVATMDNRQPATSKAMAASKSPAKPTRPATTRKKLAKKSSRTKG